MIDKLGHSFQLQMHDPAIFTNLLDNILQVRLERVWDKITTFGDTFEDLLSWSDDKINTFVKEIHNVQSARASNAKYLINSNMVLSLKSISCSSSTIGTHMMLSQVANTQTSSMRKLRIQAKINQAPSKKFHSQIWKFLSLLHRPLITGTLYLLVYLFGRIVL